MSLCCLVPWLQLRDNGKISQMKIFWKISSPRFWFETESKSSIGFHNGNCPMLFQTRLPGLSSCHQRIDLCTGSRTTWRNRYSRKLTAVRRWRRSNRSGVGISTFDAGLLTGCALVKPSGTLIAHPSRAKISRCAHWKRWNLVLWNVYNPDLIQMTLLARTCTHTRTHTVIQEKKICTHSVQIQSFCFITAKDSKELWA